MSIVLHSILYHEVTNGHCIVPISFQTVKHSIDKVENHFINWRVAFDINKLISEVNFNKRTIFRQTG